MLALHHQLLVQIVWVSCDSLPEIWLILFTGEEPLAFAALASGMAPD